VVGDKQKAAGKKEGMPKVKKESNKREREEGLQKARTHSERVPEREDPQVEANKEIKARKWIMI
jgi:hypothetical protein